MGHRAFGLSLYRLSYPISFDELINSDRLERILTMVYVVQSYWACFWTLSIVLYVEDKKYHNVSEGRVGPHPPEDGDRSSLRNVVVFFVFHIQVDG
jgi:hypothetical protein